MKDTKHTESASQFPFSNPLSEIIANNAKLWFATHAEMRADADTLTHAWLDRRREDTRAMFEAIRKITACQNPMEMLQIQQDWLSGAFHRVTEDAAALNNSISLVAEKTTNDFVKAARKVTQPLQHVGEEMLKVAGNKPQMRTSAD